MLRSLGLSFAIVLSAWAALPALSQTSGPDGLTAGQRQLAALKSTRGDITLAVRLDRPDATYRIGDTLTLSVTASEAVYLSALNVGSGGTVTVLVPNPAQPALHALPRQPVAIPPPGASFVIRVAGPPGFDLIKVIASQEPVDVLAVEPSRPAGQFRSLDKDAVALARSLPATLERQLKGGYVLSEVVIRVLAPGVPAR
jgi:hypothetical protein